MRNSMQTDLGPWCFTLFFFFLALRNMFRAILGTPVVWGESTAQVELIPTTRERIYRRMYNRTMWRNIAIGCTGVNPGRPEETIDP